MKVYLSGPAEQELDDLPQVLQEEVLASLEHMEGGVYQGDTREVDGENYLILKTTSGLTVVTRAMSNHENAETQTQDPDSVLVLAIASGSEVSG